jgi:hypothetical protein
MSARLGYADTPLAGQPPLVRSRALVLCGEQDVHSLPDVPAPAGLGCASGVIERAGVPLPERRPEAFAREVVAVVTAPHRPDTGR